MNARDRAALALVLAAIGLERAAVLAATTVATMHLYQQGATALSIGHVIVGRQVLLLLGALAGGAVAIGVGPRVTAAVGALGATLGLLALAAGASLEMGLGLVAFGGGVLAPCPVVVAAGVLAWDDRSPAAPAPHRFAAVAAFAMALAVVSHGAAMVGPMLGSMLSARDGFAAVYGSAGATAALSTALLAGAAVLGWVGRGAAADAPGGGPYRKAEAAPQGAAPTLALALSGVALLLGPEAVSRIGVSLAAPPSALRTSASNVGLLYAMSPMGALIAAAIALLVLVVAALERSTKPPILLSGAGLPVFALGLVLVAAGSASAVIFGLGALLTGAGSAVVSGVPLAYAAIAVRGRAATLVVAAWTVAGLVLGGVSSALGALEDLRAPLLGVAAGLSVCAGVLLLRFGRALHRWFEPVEVAGASSR